MTPEQIAIVKGTLTAAKEYLEAKRVAPPASKVPRAHAILGVVLEQTGYAADWEANALTPDEHIELLHLVRLEGRRWLREQASAALDEFDELESKALFGAAKEKAKAFFRGARKYIRELFVAGVLAVAGPSPMDAAEVESLDAEVAIQDAYLKTFEKEVVEGNKPPDGTFVSRAEKYGASVWGAAQEILRAGAKAERHYSSERRIHQAHDKPCEVCLEEMKKEWQPIGTLRKIGDSPCMMNCHCVFIYGWGEPGSKSFDIKRYVPCRDHRGRFASCAGAPQGTRHPKPEGGEATKPGSGKKPKRKPRKKPGGPKKPNALKKPKEQAKPKEPAVKPTDKPKTPSGAKPRESTPSKPAPDKFASNFGPSKAKVEVDADLPPAVAREQSAKAKRLLGANATDGDIASVVGAPNNAKVTITTGSLFDPDNSVNVHIKSPEMAALRQIKRTDDGELVVKNVYFYAEQTGTGLGSKVFGQQVEHAVRLGATRIETEAGRGEDMNGYITWPKLGYDAPLSVVMREKLPKGLSSAQNVSDLMRTKRGTDWWAKHGQTTLMEFDLRPGSKSRTHLEKYLKRKGLAE